MKKKIAVVTGAKRGIGFETVEATRPKGSDGCIDRP